MNTTQDSPDLIFAHGQLVRITDLHDQLVNPLLAKHPFQGRLHRNEDSLIDIGQYDHAPFFSITRSRGSPCSPP